MIGIPGIKRRKQTTYRQAILWLAMTAVVLAGIAMLSTGETERLQPASIYVVDGDTIALSATGLISRFSTVAKATGGSRP